ncbi:inducible T cell costimulator [Rhinolophus ferrumequinum]|uniref:Inducible T-cell costimulator n=2 Tax=Rhinolophus ferrumequinum TaxID=59479 RepID=A0A671F1E4_RHIFE|nr:inducible T-cell costimulator isoform X1 [Rhinolophus ferrumequinum]KAF6361568.1 inducible T cell costimulator [Rhinolophus ferrumequinum]
MKSHLWYLFLFCFQVEVLTGEINDSAKSEMFAFRNGDVHVLCKYKESVQQFKMQLLKGEQILCDLTKTKGSGNTVSIQNLKFCKSQLSNNSVSFVLNNLDSSHASYYLCKLSIFDPPPFQEIFSKEYLHIYESQLCSHLKFWLPMGCTTFAVVCTVGCVFLCWLKQKKRRPSVHDPNSEYMFMAAVTTAKKTGLTDVTRNLELPSIQA